MTDTERERGAGLEFQEWLHIYQNHQEAQNDRMGELTAQVRTLASTVDTLVRNQDNLFKKTNKGTNWFLVLGAVSLSLSCIALVTAPLYNHVDRLQSIRFEQERINLQDSYEDGRQDSQIEMLREQIRDLTHRRKE